MKIMNGWSSPRASFFKEQSASQQQGSRRGQMLWPGVAHRLLVFCHLPTTIQSNTKDQDFLLQKKIPQERPNQCIVCLFSSSPRVKGKSSIIYIERISCHVVHYRNWYEDFHCDPQAVRLMDRIDKCVSREVNVTWMTLVSKSDSNWPVFGERAEREMLHQRRVSTTIATENKINSIFHSSITLF